jgi:hypothetical protein
MRRHTTRLTTRTSFGTLITLGGGRSSAGFPIPTSLVAAAGLWFVGLRPQRQPHPESEQRHGRRPEARPAQAGLPSYSSYGLRGQPPREVVAHHFPGQLVRRVHSLRRVPLVGFRQRRELNGGFAKTDHLGPGFPRPAPGLRRIGRVHDRTTGIIEAASKPSEFLRWPEGVRRWWSRPR